jgi:hypothetical protein
MSRSVLTFLAAAVLLAGCGPDAIDVSGPWSGAHSLIVTGGETAGGQEGIVVTQRGNDLSFHFAGCSVTAEADTAEVFDIYGFDCTRQVNTQMWRLRGGRGSRITASASSFNMTVSGDAESGDTERAFTWTFNGNR